MKDDLLRVYRSLLTRAAQLPSPLMQRLGCPFFPFPRDRWTASTKRVLIVGQEPREWGFNNGLHYHWPHPPLWSLTEALAYDRSVEALTYAYVTHTYEIQSPYRPTPFTRVFDLFMAAVNREDMGDVINTNLFRCILWVEGQPNARSPVLNATPDEFQQIIDWQRGSLTKEVEVLDPTSVVFLTGPRYDHVLADEFFGVKFERIENREVRQFSRVLHPSLPAASFRTYHPGYLARTGRWSWLQELADEISR